MYAGDIFILCYIKTYICYCILWHKLFKKSHNMHMFFSLVWSTPGPMSSLDTVSKFTVSQWDLTSSMVGYDDHVSTASSQRDCESQSTLNLRFHENLANRCGFRSSSHSRPLSETRHAAGNSLLKNKLSSIMQYLIYFISCTMVNISVWYIVIDSHDSVTLFMDLETRGVISSNRLTW